MDSQEWFEFKEYIRTLLKDGKRSQHPDFQVLFNLFGKNHVVEIAKAILESEKCGNEEVSTAQSELQMGSPRS